MNRTLAGVRRFVQGKARKILFRAIILLLLVDVGFIFVMPLLRMLSQSLMHVMDFYDPTVVWIPRHWSWENYRLVYQALTYPLTFKNTFLLAIIAAILQTTSCAIVGYGFARFNFPGRDRLFLLVLFAMIVPPHAIFIQLFMLYKSLPAPLELTSSTNWLNTYLPFYVPEAMGMGLRGALFVFIFRQFFKGMPWELEDAALIDGAGPFRLFFSIMLPPAQPAIVVVFLFSFVWHWNDSLQPAIFVDKANLFVMMQQLAQVEAALASMQYRAMWNTGAIMAAALMVILPLLLLYMFTQRYFVESIERTGLIG